MITDILLKLFNKDKLSFSKVKMTPNCPAPIASMDADIRGSGIKIKYATDSDADSTSHTNSFWMNSRGVGMDVCGKLTVDYNPVTREEFDAYLKGGKIDDLKSEIERNRRNKKKVSHLVAKLAELESGK